jgi:drug/metabolite transporter (DMT)-like permease
MQSSLFLAMGAGLGGMLGWGLADLFAKKTIDEIGDVATLAWAHVFGSLGFIIFAFYKFSSASKPIILPHGLSTWALLVLFGILQAIVYLLVYKGFGKGQVAVLNPVFASFSGLTALFSILIFGEIVSAGLVVSLFILFLGVLLMNLDLKAFLDRRIDFVHVPGFKEVALATLLAAVWTISWDKFVSGHDWVIYSLCMYVFMTLFILVYANFRKIKLTFRHPYAWKFLVLIGFCETLAYLAVTYGYSMTSHTSIVALLSGAFSLPTIILARMFLKEKISLAQIIGGVIIIFGIVLLAFF